MSNERNWNLTSCSNPIWVMNMCAGKIRCATYKHLSLPLANNKTKSTTTKTRAHMEELLWKWTLDHSQEWTVIKPNCDAYHNYHAGSFLTFLALNKIHKSIFTVRDLLLHEMCACQVCLEAQKYLGAPSFWLTNTFDLLWLSGCCLPEQKG